MFGLIGLSGSLSIYREEIDSLLNPELVIAPTQGPVLSLDKILTQIRKAHPNRHGAWTLELPRSEQGTITAWFEKPRESVDKFYAPLMVAVNPYTGEVVGSRFWGQTLGTWLLDMHTHLQLENSGRNLVAILAVLLSISVASGLYLWWPGRARLTQAFKIRQDAGLMRFLMDLHRLLGLLSALFLLLLAFTGFHLAYPKLLESLTASAGMGHGDEGPNIRSTAIPNDRPVGIAEAVLIARGLFPSSEVRRITTPTGDLGTYRINLRQRQELNQHHPFTTVWVDRWSGQIRGVNNPSQFSAGQTFTTWQWPLHTGEAFGANSRPIWFIMGLMPLTLWLSGVCHWLSRKGLIRDRPLDLITPLRSTSRLLWQRGFYYANQAGRVLYPLLLAALGSLAAWWADVKNRPR
ncbi:PepSY-associated TM helix domain-containing protein [Methylomonas sp. LL1]|uniref:PepSY-associated TM helix domain-containing protein n=1 Tax=Methylomonas sp. LL1 TaxID=2785785 RepID=UPI001E335C35|nr:PepSY-associated TM helix domain-containing protein [Methylomonas sp. LL1]